MKKKCSHSNNEKAFAPKTELRRELDLYKTLMDNNNLQEKIAEKILMETKTQHSKVNQEQLFKEQVSISKINKQLSKEVLPILYQITSTLPLFHNLGSSEGLKTKVLLETQVVERLTNQQKKHKPHKCLRWLSRLSLKDLMILTLHYLRAKSNSFLTIFLLLQIPAWNLTFI